MGWEGFRGQGETRARDSMYVRISCVSRLGDWLQSSSGKFGSAHLLGLHPHP